MSINNTNDFFTFHESQQIAPEKIYEALTGKLAGCIFRNVVGKTVRDEISKKFWQSPGLRERTDDVPAFYLGTYHYDKKLEHYFTEAESIRNDINNLFSNTENLLENFIQSLAEYLKPKNIHIRLAEHGEKKACALLMRSWSNDDNYALKPHEDLAQCKDPKQHGFEIQKVVNYEPIAVNICLENGSGGNLMYWDIQPDDEIRNGLNLEGLGYPYPDDFLCHYRKITLPIYAGDIYCFNGRNVHAVETMQGEKKRTTISFLMGFIDDKTLVYWT
jgi:hypothetical protein